MAASSKPATPVFSIIIPAYNRSEIIGRAIASCLGQTFRQFEVVVVDDGSTDETEAAVRRHDDPRIVYVRQANQGAAAARNFGAAIARGRYLAFLDSDDSFLPEKLHSFNEQIEASGKNGERTVWYSPLRFFRGDGNALVKPERAIRPGEPVGDYLFADEGLLQTSTLVLPKALFDEVRFDAALRNLQDLDLCLRLEAAGARYEMLPEAQVVWYDVNVTGRISYSTRADQVSAWVERQSPLLSERAYHGFLARYLVPRIVRTDPVRAARIMGSAVLKGSISPARATSVLVRGVAPNAYARLRDAVVTLQARRISQPHHGGEQ